MLAGLVYLASLEGENFCGRYTRRAGETGIRIASGALPRHISLGTPHTVTDFQSYIENAAQLASSLPPLKVKLTRMAARPVQVGTHGACWLGFHYQPSEVLEASREQVGDWLKQEGIRAVTPDPIRGTSHLTLLVGKEEDTALCQTYAQDVESSAEGTELVFDQLGVFFYEGNHFGDGDYFCCHRFALHSSTENENN